ncbi:MAG: TolA-binding protein [Pirellulaceae bacterium]|jgi:TolA-binding protein
MNRTTISWTLLSIALFAVSTSFAQDAPPPVRGSLIEDRAARKLVEAGDARYEVDEITKSIEIWKSVIERYPRSRVRFLAHMRLGNYFLERDRAYDRARTHFEAASLEENRDEDVRAEATLKMGICFYHDRNYGKCFQVMRGVIETFPVSEQVNNAYYYIGLGHFQLGHYSRAIAALEKVGTALNGEDEQVDKLEAGKRFFVKIEDADLAVLDPDQGIDVICKASSGDVEKVKCFPVGRNVRVVLGSIATRLGKPNSQNGYLEVQGGDTIQVTYTDQHTAAKKLDQPVIREVSVVGNAYVAITDGAFSETLRGVVLGKTVNVRINDADRDVSDAADKLTAVLEVYRLKTDEELEDEAAAAAAALVTEGAEGETPLLDEEQPEIDRYKLVDKVEVGFVEVKVENEFISEQPAAALPNEPAAPAVDTDPASAPPVGPVPAAEESATDEPAAAPPADTAPATPAPEPAEPDNSIHSGIFQATISLVRAETAIAGDDVLQALPSDEVRVSYLDETNRDEGVRQVVSKAKCLEGNIGGVRVARAVISDHELRIQTQLKTAGALTEIGNRYKEFGLTSKADEKYTQALDVCDEVMGQARKLGGGLLEQTYVQLWKTYFEMENIPLAAAMCQRLQREFPSSGFVDDALLQLGDVARVEKDYQRAIGVYSRLVNMKTSQLRGEAQFGIAECYEKMAEGMEGPGGAQMRDRAFQEFKNVFDRFPESGRVGEAVAKMANYYYQQQDYNRAIDTFETVLNDHPDAKFLDVILFNYGRCLYRMGRKAQARQRFDQLIGDYPESPLAPDAKKISEALASAPK